MRGVRCPGHGEHSPRACVNASRKGCLWSIIHDRASWLGKGGQCGAAVQQRKGHGQWCREAEHIVCAYIENSRGGVVQDEAGQVGGSQTVESLVG